MPYKIIFRCFLWLLLSGAFFTANAQYFDIAGHKRKVTIPFKLIRNLVIIKLKINGNGPYNFIMDTGAGIMIITDPGLADSLNIPCNKVLKLTGCANGADYEAHVTSVLNVQIPGLKSYNVEAAILEKDEFQLSNYVGMPVTGLLGYEFFDNLAVKVNFEDSTLTCYRSKDEKRFAKGDKVPITVENRKPYLVAKVHLPNGDVKNSKLIIDLGAGHPMLLDCTAQLHQFAKKYIEANLGVGFNGPITGYLSRINEIDIGKYDIKNLISSFPEQDAEHVALDAGRDGNLGIGLLKRFVVVFDYTHNALYLKRGRNFKEPFEHDMSGLEYYAAGDGFKHIFISRVEPGSAGDAVGLQRDDEIVAINMKPTADMSLEQIDDIFRSQNDRNLLLEVYHDKKYDNVIITLKRRI